MELQASPHENAAPGVDRIASRGSSATPSQSTMWHDSEKDLEQGEYSKSTSTTPQSDVEKATDAVQDQEAPSRPDLVEFDGPDDPGNPKNWSKRRRWVITISGSLLTFTVTFSSSIFSVAIVDVAKEYDVSRVVSTLGVSLFLAGFILGPVVFGPMSEAYGRKLPLLSGFIVFAIFQIPVAVAQNIETIILGRFFGGLFGSSPLAVVGGLMNDIWDPIPRAYAICAFAAGGFAGSVFPSPSVFVADVCCTQVRLSVQS